MVLLAKNYHYIEFSEPRTFFFVFFFFGRPGSREAGTGPGEPGRTGKYRKTRKKKNWPARDLARNTEFPFYGSY